MSVSFLSRFRIFALSSRILATRLIVTVPCILLLITDNRWAKNGVADMLFETVGFVLVGLGTFGRLWALLYVSGYKNTRLVTEGPYSIVRNPLYIFSFMGAIGLGFASESLLIVGMVVAAFVFFYPLVVTREEKELALKHGAEFALYASQTPRFIPKPSMLHEPETYLVNAKQYRRAFFDATFFVWIYGLLQIIEKMHQLKILPSFFKIP